MSAMDPCHDALNGDTLGEAPPLIIPWPVTSPQATVATTATPVAMNVRRQTGVTSGSRPVASRDWPMRTAHTAPTPTRASAAIAMCAGRIIAAVLPTNAASAHVARRPPSTARPYIDRRTATAARPYMVIPKIRPTARELK